MNLIYFNGKNFTKFFSHIYHKYACDVQKYPFFYGNLRKAFFHYQSQNEVLENKQTT